MRPVFFVLALLFTAVEPPLPDLTGVEPQVRDKLESLRRAVAESPESAAAWGRLAMTLDVHDFKREAARAYERAATLEPAELRWPYYRAICLLEFGMPEAFAELERASSLDPDYEPLLLKHGEALLGAGELEAAAEKFWPVASAAPELATHAHLGLARIALARGELETSLRHARRAVELAPRHGAAHGLLAEVHRRLGDRRRAEHEMGLARRLAAPTGIPDPLASALVAEGVSSYWYQQRGRSYLAGRDYQRAARELRAALAAAPTAELHDLLGLALYYLGRYEEALGHHRAALTLQPEFPAALLHLGADLLETGELEAAAEAVERALELQPELPGGELNLGRIHLEAGNHRAAAEAFRRGLSQSPDDPRLAWRLAWVLATAPEDELRDGEEARRHAEHACRLTGLRMPEALDALAAAYAESGHFDRAARAAHRARSLASRSGRGELARRIEERWKLYASGEPYREPRP